MTATELPEAPPPSEKLSMGIDPYERNWMLLSVALLVVFFATVSVAGFAMGFQVSGADSEVDPATVLEEGPFATPGLRQISEDHYEAYVVAKTWVFEPRELEIPVGATVDIYVTTPDLQHGFKITDTNVNMQVVPGQVSKLTFTFDEVGEYPYICHEYCGSGHATMFGVVNVVPASATSADAGADADDDAAETDDATDAEDAQSQEDGS
ncbi:MAG: cytochrome c oxidase subunit II [Actinomycetota bacterium]